MTPADQPLDPVVQCLRIAAARGRKLRLEREAAQRDARAQQDAQHDDRADGAQLGRDETQKAGGNE